MLFPAVGLSASTRKLAEEGIDRINVVAEPQGGPHVQAWMLGGTVSKAIYRGATIELELAQVAAGYHFIELFIGGIYPHHFFDATPVEIDGRLMNGTPIRRFVPRMQTLALPRLVIEVFATLAGGRLSAFTLSLPEFHARQSPA